MDNRYRGDYSRIDTRLNILKKIISPFQNHLNEIYIINKKSDFIHWDSVYADDTEHFVGTAFIAFQNYINSSIHDLYPELKKTHTKYSFDKKLNNSNTTRIELIIAIANFYKHRDSPDDLQKNTIKPLEDLDISFKQIFTNDNTFFHKIGSDSPVFSGFALLSEFWNLNDLIKIVSEWRENLWLNEIEFQKKWKK